MTWILVSVTLIIGFYMLWNIGANDVANAVGTSVGSGAITLKKAILIAAILEFLGAFLVGSNVSETIQHGIVEPTFFLSDPNIFVLGMLSSLLATAIWLQIATFFGWPVSTTHAIIGAVIGFGALVGGVNTIHWREVGTIAISWILSPFISALISYFFFAFIQKKILFAYNPLLATKRIAPYLVFIVLFTFVIASLTNGLNNIHVTFPLYLVILIALLCGVIGAILCRFGAEKMHYDRILNPIIAARQEQQLYSLNKVQKHLFLAKLASTGKMSLQISDLIQAVNGLVENVKDQTKWESHLSSDYRSVERIFGVLQILTGCFVAFAHGANDVANAVGPVSGILEVIKDPSLLATKTPVPAWLLALGGLGIVIGLATYGWRVIETIGKNITELTPTRGFSAEFGAAVTILVASKLGLPISTTHAIVGAVLGVGLARGLSSVNFRVLRDIFLSWIITIPSSAIASILLYYFLRQFF